MLPADFDMVSWSPLQSVPGNCPQASLRHPIEMPHDRGSNLTPERSAPLILPQNHENGYLTTTTLQNKGTSYLSKKHLPFCKCKMVQYVYTYFIVEPLNVDIMNYESGHFVLS